MIDDDDYDSDEAADSFRISQGISTGGFPLGLWLSERRPFGRLRSKRFYTAFLPVVCLMH